MKFRCFCDNVIYDMSDEDSFDTKGWLLPYYAYYALNEIYLPLFTRYVEAVEQGRGTAWIKEQRLSTMELSMEDMVRQIAWNVDPMPHIYECSQCQRLWISHPHAEGYFSFKPEFPETTPRDFLREPHADADQSTPADNEER
ncbi:hypothetical protein [Herpetosiphon llansteffanensis]|uniref:hypothetical protein n=1 Tax=Herpetosiphon llansteffanensis TaxID=2094568 RepID=UPI000D7CAFF2|nr:hypothetical protein [Herpetosiphon llansteffanensis]